MKIKFLFYFILFSSITRCENLEPRKPINNNVSGFLKKSAIKNKERVALEQVLIYKARTRDNENLYKESNLGFLYSIDNHKKNKILAKKGDHVEIEYKIEDINKNLLYDSNELKKIKFIVDKEEVLPALREGVKLMSVGDTGVFLFPSHFCYGYLGDFEKITSNQPLRFTIKLVSLKKI